VITYYQPTRALIGKLKIEVLDSQGKVLDTLSASKRPGINRVAWSMRAPAPKAPSAAQLAFNASQGPRLPPGDYTVRITKGDQVYTTKIAVSLDRRATFNIDDRKAQFSAATRAGGLFNRMSALVDQINAVREGAEARTETGKPEGALKAKLNALAQKADVLRKEIVATKEGGAITGEERLREHLDSLYGALNGYEGRPSDYQINYLAVLEAQLVDLNKRFDALATGDLAAVNAALVKASIAPIELPSPASEDSDTGAGGAKGVPALAGWRFSLRDVQAATRRSEASERE